MKSPDAPIAKKGFFVTHFLTVKDQAIEGILRGDSRRESREAGKSVLHQAGKLLDYSQLGRRAHAGQARSDSRDTTEFKSCEQFLKSACRGHPGLLQEMECERSAFSDRAVGQSRLRMEMLHAGSGWLLNRSGRVFADIARPLQEVCVADKEKVNRARHGCGRNRTTTKSKHRGKHVKPKI